MWPCHSCPRLDGSSLWPDQVRSRINISFLERSRFCCWKTPVVSWGRRSWLFNQRQPWLLIARMTLVERKRRMGLGRVARQHMHGNSALRRRLVLRKQPRDPKSPAELRPGTPTTHQASTAAPVHVMTAVFMLGCFFPQLVLACTKKQGIHGSL